MSNTIAANETLNMMFEQVKQKFGFVPNLAKEMSVSPVTLELYLKGQEIIAKGTLTSAERQIIQLVISQENRCHYCAKVHSVMLKNEGFPPEEIQQMLNDTPFANPRYESLAELTRLILDKQGWLSADELKAFEEKGIFRAQVLEIIGLVGLKVISNYVNHISNTPVDTELSCALS